MPLSQQIQDQIRKDAKAFYTIEDFEDYEDYAYYSGAVDGYVAGATAEAEKAQIVVTLLQEMIDIYKLTLRKYAFPAANEKFDVTENSPIIKRATTALQSYTKK